jgi:hypothetical protein
MSLRTRALLLAAPFLISPLPAQAQPRWDNPYEEVSAAWGELPDGREWGAVSAIFPGPDGRTVWVAERCGQNTCVGREEMDPILQFDLDGRLLRSFGAGLIAWPHGIFVDREGNVWVTDALGFGVQPQGLGHMILKFSPEGEVLMTLGVRGAPGAGPDRFTKPSDILVAPSGEIFVVDGHDATGNNRVVKFAADGTFLREWGVTGGDTGEFRDPHALAMDSRGRLFVADRANSRIQLFDQEGTHLATWTQFGRPSGLFIDSNDVLYAVDSESNTRRNPGWRRGVYIGDAATGWVTHFIPDPVPDQDNSATSGGEGVMVDAEGNLYTAEVGPETVRKFRRVR